MTTHRALPLSVLCFSLALLGSGCGNPAAEPSASPSPEAVIDPGDGGQYAPAIEAANFVDTVDNPYFPLAGGSRWIYDGTSEGEAERVDVVVTLRASTILGISATIVRDTVTIAGEVVEDTYDWYAQDRDGNVWYLGEAVQDFENGQVISMAGSWEAGVDGAYPGIVMKADPKVGDSYRRSTTWSSRDRARYSGRVGPRPPQSGPLEPSRRGKPTIAAWAWLAMRVSGLQGCVTLTRSPLGDRVSAAAPAARRRGGRPG